MKTRKSIRPRRWGAALKVGALAASLALLASCGSGSGSGSGSSNPPAAGPVELVWSNDAAWHKPGQDALGAATSKSMNVSVKSQIFPTTDAYQAQVLSTIGSGSAFPLADWWSGYRLQELASRGALTDLSSVWDTAIARGEYTADEKKLYSFDGKAYGLPKLENYWGVFYNKKVFSQYGIAVPKTWQDMVAACAKLKSHGVYPFGQDIADASWASFIWFQEALVGTDPALYTGVLDGTVAYNDPRVVQAVGTWTDFIQKGYITPTALLNSENTVPDFKKGVFAMQLMGDWQNTNLLTGGLSPSTDYGFFAMPGITEAGARSMIVEARLTVLPNSAKDAESAKKFADYFMSTEGASVWAETAKINSPNLKVPSSSRPPALVDVTKAVKAGSYDLYPRYWEGTPTPVVNAVYPLLGKIAEKPADAASILNDAQAAAQAAWPEK